MPETSSTRSGRPRSSTSPVVEPEIGEPMPPGTIHAPGAVRDHQLVPLAEHDQHCPRVDECPAARDDQLENPVELVDSRSASSRRRSLVS